MVLFLKEFFLLFPEKRKLSGNVDFFLFHGVGRGQLPLFEKHAVLSYGFLFQVNIKTR